MPKKVAVYGGIALIWIGGFVAIWKVSDIIGKNASKLCWRGTEKLLSLI